MLETILKLCAQSAPEPWHPGEFAATMGVDRDRFDTALNDLRMAGLIQIAGWVSGRGQGYMLTPAGEQVVQSPRHLAALRSGRIVIAEPAQRRRTEVLDERTPYGRGEAIRNVLLYPQKPRVTYVLMGINILVFIVGLLIAMRNGRMSAFLFGVEPNATHWTGAVSGGDLITGEWWRLLTCCFVHYGVLHLFLNMYALYSMGDFVEQVWGRTRYLVIYLLAGIGGSTGAMLINPVPQLAGASGAIFGLLGAIAVWWLANRKFLPPNLFRENMNRLITVLIMNAVISFLPGISWTAHFAGGAAGAVIAILLHVHRFGPSPWRWVFLLLVPLVPALTIGLLYRHRATDVRFSEIREADEIRLFNRDFLPRIRQVEKNIAEKINEDYDRFEKSNQRRPNETRRWQDDLMAIRSDAQKLVQELDAAGFRAPLVSDAARDAKEYLTQIIRLVGAIDDKLRTKADFDESVQSQIERMSSAQERFKKRLK